MMGHSYPTTPVCEVPVIEWPDELVDLYQATYRRHVQLAFVMVGSRDEAEELVQDAVFELARAWPGVESPPAYLRRSVVNRAIGLLRRRAVEHRHRVDPPPPSAPRYLVELRDVLLGLPERQRAAIALRYLEGLDDAEIARALGCKRATVRSLIFRALRTLRSEVPK